VSGHVFSCECDTEPEREKKGELGRRFGKCHYPYRIPRKNSGHLYCPRVVNPSAGKGSPEGDANVRGYVRGL